MFGWLLDQIWGLLQLLGLVTRQLEEEEGTRVTIKAVSGQSVSLVLRPNWTILDVKTSLSSQLGTEPSELRIIFAGKELRDDVAIDTCNLGNQSILHAVKIVRQNASHTVQVNSVEVSSVSSNNGLDVSGDKVVGEDPLCESLVDLQLTGKDREEVSVEEQPTKRAHFYTYCTDSLHTAKLRVRCSQCGEGAIVLHTDPCSWEDVLRPDRLQGYCETCRQVTSVEFYFRCGGGGHNHPPDQSTVPLYLVKSNLGEVPCLACTEASCDPVLVFTCQSRHVICVSCFADYGRSRLGERQFIMDPVYGYTLPCPVSCEGSLIDEPQHFRLLGSDNWDRYQRFGAEELVLQSGGVLCPQPGCGAGIITEQEGEEVCTRVACTECQYVFCRDCLQGAHIGPCLPCGSDMSGDREGTFSGTIDPSDPRASKARWTDPSSVTIRVISKPCPRCRTPTERDGGCMHMICTKPGCAFHWCWVCQVEWTRECMANHWFG